MPTLSFILSISSQDYLRFYQGTGKTVVTTSVDGRQVQFPAARLRPFVSHNGVHGRFELKFDHNNKFVSLHRTEAA